MPARKSAQSGLAALDERFSNAFVGGVRILAGLLWLANLEWKRPPNFGRNVVNGQIVANGLYRYIDSAIRNPVFPPYSWFLENVVLTQYRFFGWFILVFEGLLAALLLLGYRTRLVALVASVLSIAILFSVLFSDTVVVWPWSYYMMIGLHLLLVAIDAGKYVGLDGVRSGHLSVRNTRVVLAGVAIVAGALGLFVSRGTGFGSNQGALVGAAGWDLKLLWFNPLSALLTIVGGVLLLIGRDVRWFRYLSAAWFGALALLTLLMWRGSSSTAWSGGFLGATGANYAFWLMLAIGALLSSRE